MIMNSDAYAEKFATFAEQRLYKTANPNLRRFIQQLAFQYRFTFQEFRLILESARDLFMWNEDELEQWWRSQNDDQSLTATQQKKRRLNQLSQHMETLKKEEKEYPETPWEKPKRQLEQKFIRKESDAKIMGSCPVESEDTICCQLKTIDSVENCSYGCSYCTIQTFYQNRVVFIDNLAEKLREIPIDPDRFYHFGTGQSSDSLLWGNRGGGLDDLCEFAANHQNILLEFKTKSNNIHYFEKNRTPSNIVCSWSLNTPAIIENEEHFTATLDQRLAAARKVADLGVKVAFHFHPMIYYKNWEADYSKIALRIINEFSPKEILFISFGTVTLIKPVIRKIREIGNKSKILQMPFAKDPKGKLTYPDEIKVKMFRHMLDLFASWKDQVYFYLCMEKRKIWEETFGHVYSSNDAFEIDFGKKVMGKIAE